MACNIAGWPLTLRPGASILTLLDRRAVIGAGGIFLPNTPNSLVERGDMKKGKAVLQRVRGTDDVEVEFASIVMANKAQKNIESPWRSILR